MRKFIKYSNTSWLSSIKQHFVATAQWLENVIGRYSMYLPSWLIFNTFFNIENKLGLFFEFKNN